MKKTVYEKLLKRIDGERSKNSAEIDSRFELPPVDVMWEGQRTYLRNFSDFQK
jgi:translation initiation factor 2 subunit 2